MKLFTQTFAPERSSAAQLRAWLSTVLAQDNVAPTASQEIVLAAEEALANAILHSGQRGGDLTVTLSMLASDVYLTVADRGRGFDSAIPGEQAARSPETTGGLGLTLVRGLMDEVTVASSAEGTSIRLVKHLRGAAFDAVG